MCGIFIALSKNKPLDILKCKTSFFSIQHRGPDYSYFNFDSKNFFGQHVLSVSESDPFIKRNFLYNGEIYNFDSKESDTIELSRLLENNFLEDIIHILDGAYVIIQKKNDQLQIVRDPQGEKTIFVYEDDEIILISSEFSPILNFVNCHLDFETIRSYFYTRHLLQIDKTIYKNVFQVEPGELCNLNLKTFKWKRRKKDLSQFVDMNKLEEFNSRSEDSLIEELDELLKNNVKQMIPDKKFATIVSGGVDSTLLSNYLKNDTDLLVAIDHIGKDRISNNLIPFEKELGKIHVIKICAKDFAKEIVNVQKNVGIIPVHSFVSQSILSSYVKNKKCKVIFGGEGADELFGGYESYLTENISPYTRYEGKDTHLKNKLNEAYEKAKKIYDNDEKLSMMFCDLQYQNPSIGCRTSESMSMLHGVESRSVYLRKEILKFGLNLPLRFKINYNAPDKLKCKYLLKKLYLKYFPENLLFKKQGFSGFPNESKKFLNLKIEETSKELEWKWINLKSFMNVK